MNIYETIRSIKPNVFLELGANSGETAAKINGYFSPKIYIAFEPDPRFTTYLKEVASKYPNMQVEIKAVSNKNGQMRFWLSDGIESREGLPKQHFDCSSSIKKPTEEIFKAWPDMTFDKIIDIETIRLDDYCDFDIDFIWSDIQGAELDMIEGARKTLARTRYLYTEYNNNKIYEGCPDLKGIMDALPDWELVHDFDGDALLRNTKL